MKRTDVAEPFAHALMSTFNFPIAAVTDRFLSLKIFPTASQIQNFSLDIRNITEYKTK